MNAPFLIADASHWQGPNPNWGALLAHAHVAGVILKATEGTYYTDDVFERHWSRLRELAGGRYGDTFFRGAYHYLDCRAGTAESGREQARFFLAYVARCGGWGHGDMMPFVDVELGGVNKNVSARDVITVCTAYADEIERELGRKVILYGRGIMRDLGIKSRMGCAAVWNPGYTATMPLNGLTPTWSRDDVVLWQYTDGNAGDASSGTAPNGLPLRIEGFGQALDLSVYVDGARKPTLASLRRRLLGGVPYLALALLFFAALIAHKTFIA